MQELKEQIVDKVVIVNNEVIKRKELIGSICLPKGTFAWEYNRATGETTLAQFEETVIEVFERQEFAGGTTVDHKKDNKMIVKENHRYVCALNKKNAERKFQLLEKEDQ